MCGEKGSSSFNELRVLLVLFFSISSIVCCGRASGYTLFYMENGFLWSNSRTAINQITLKDSCSSMLVVSLGYSNIYGVHGISLNEAAIEYADRNKFGFRAGISKLRYLRIYNEKELFVSSTFPIISDKLLADAETRLFFYNLPASSARVNKAFIIGASIIPSRNIYIKCKSKIFDPYASYDRSVSVTFDFGGSYAEYTRVRFMSGVDQLFSVSLGLSEKLSLKFGYRVRNEEILAGLSAGLSSVLIDLISINHPVLGTSFYVCVGWMWLLKK